MPHEYGPDDGSPTAKQRQAQAPADTPVRVYIDTEFTTLDPPEEAELLSVALVVPNGRSCYLELVDDDHFAHSSDFVRREVLPQFSQIPGAEAASYQDLADRVAACLLSLGLVAALEIRYDEVIDRKLLLQALQRAEAWPALEPRIRWLNVTQEASTNEAQAAIEAYWAELATWSPLRRHHALADAGALLAGVEADDRADQGRAP